MMQVSQGPRKQEQAKPQRNRWPEITQVRN